MELSDFDYDLPPELIAQEPAPERGGSRMLVVNRSAGTLEDRFFTELPDLLAPSGGHAERNAPGGDIVVLNNTRVLRARLFGRRLGIRAQPVSPRNPAARNFLSGTVEVLLARRLDGETWECLVHPGRKVGIGERISFAGGFEAEVIARGEFGARTLRFGWVGDFYQQLDHVGHVPLPPYIRRADRPEDAARYQTVYARAFSGDRPSGLAFSGDRPSGLSCGSVAAPTAGLHFTPEMLERLRARGIATPELSLDVGLGTFQPVRVERVEEHRMHSERYHIPPETAAAVNRALEDGRRVVAVGTTTVRALEHSAAQGRVRAGDADCALFIYPGFRFRVTGALLTNFHLPRSTLLMLVAAFAGRQTVLAAYRHAVRRRYRFYSYGDCMLLL